MTGTLLTLLFCFGAGPAPRPPSTPPAYKLLIEDARRISAVQTLEIDARTLAATEWVVVAARAPELPGQSRVSTRMEPSGASNADLSSLHRPIVWARIPAHGVREHRLTVRVTYRATLRARQLVPLAPGEPAPDVPPLTPADRRAALAATPTLDFSSKGFHAWLNERALSRNQDEDDVAFARRVFSAVRRNFRYQWPADPDGRASSICRAGRGDCGNLSAVFVAALRAGGVPARALVGHWSQSINPNGRPSEGLQSHVKAEFFADGIGWVPVDVTAALNRRSPVDLEFFGNDRGDFLVQHVDYDMIVNTAHFGRQTVRYLQGVAHWVVGTGPWSGLETREDWQVQTLPFGPGER